MCAVQLLHGPPGARAATVAVVAPPPAFSTQDVVFTAAPGEQNDVSVGRTDDYDARRVAVVTISDAGAVITPGAGCQAVDPHTVACTVLFLVGVVRADLGDGNDELHTIPSDSGQPPQLLAVVANGGPGDDVLDVRQRGAGVLDGGGGRDELYGGALDDFLTDGDRDDATGADAPGPDVLDGGGPSVAGFNDGGDLVSYEQRTNPVVVDLAGGGSAGETGEGDVVRNIESVFGGTGPDRLAGTDGPNYLTGGKGLDTLIGRGGNDVFGGVPANLTYSMILRLPYPGNGARGDAVSCGTGDDEIWNPGSGNYIEPACEHVRVPRRVRGVRVGLAWMPAYPQRQGSSLRYSFGCSADEDWDTDLWRGVKCPGTVTLREVAASSRLLAIGATRALDPFDYEARLRLTALGRRLAARHQRVDMVLRISGHNMPNTHWVIRLTLPRQPSRRHA
jgi:RTX calcium-binding nonapeptide repeat (4 copies)